MTLSGHRRFAIAHYRCRPRLYGSGHWALPKSTGQTQAFNVRIQVTSGFYALAAKGEGDPKQTFCVRHSRCFTSSGTVDYRAPVSARPTSVQAALAPIGDRPCRVLVHLQTRRRFHPVIALAS